MGTRNVTVVIHKGEVKMAQYGQWDGYPSGVGKDIAKVLQKAPIKKWREAISNCKFLTETQVEERWKKAGADGSGWVNMDVSAKFKQNNEILSRDSSGGKALELILKNNGAEIFNNIEFAGDSLFCEWAYVVDLDKQMVEVYKGFNNEPLTKNDRFFFLQKATKKTDEAGDNTYFPVKLYKTYKFKSFTTRAMTALEKKMNAEAEAEEAKA